MHSNTDCVNHVQQHSDLKERRKDRRTDNTMAKRKKDKRTNNDLQNINIKLKIEQHEPH
jgi:hypothetical protein